MKISLLISLIIIILMTISGTSFGSVTDEHTIDEWRSILALNDDEGRLTGLQVSLTIEPDRYYLPEGTPVNISGQLNNIFGPVALAPITLAKGYDEKPIAYTTLITDDQGEFFSSDTVNQSGIMRYQAWFEGSDQKDSNRTMSQEIEIRGGKYAALSGEIGGAVMTPDTSGYLNASLGDAREPAVNIIVEPADNRQIQKEQENYEDITQVQESEDFPEPADSEINQTSPASITLLTDANSYTSGQNVTFTGTLTGVKKTPLAHRVVNLEIANGKEEFKKIGDSRVTDRNGTYSVSYHLTGPDAPVFRAISTDERGNELMSAAVSLTFLPDDSVPPAKIRPDSRHIDAVLTPALIQTGENITLSGWFSDGNGNPIPSGRLNLYWYNFGDQIWDRYEHGSDAITNRDGYYTINVTGPKYTGVSYMAMVSKYEENGKPLFSQALALTVRDELNITPSILPAILKGISVPDEIRVSEPAAITFTLADPSGSPLPGEPVQIFFSEDGFTWYMNGDGNLTTGSGGTISFNDTPKQPGFHYYRGVYNGTEAFGPADSGVLVLAISGNETESKEYQ